MTTLAQDLSDRQTIKDAVAFLREESTPRYHGPRFRRSRPILGRFALPASYHEIDPHL